MWLNKICMHVVHCSCLCIKHNKWYFILSESLAMCARSLALSHTHRQTLYGWLMRWLNGFDWFLNLMIKKSLHSGLWRKPQKCDGFNRNTAMMWRACMNVVDVWVRINKTKNDRAKNWFSSHEPRYLKLLNEIEQCKLIVSWFSRLSYAQKRLQ